MAQKVYFCFEFWPIGDVNLGYEVVKPAIQSVQARFLAADAGPARNVGTDAAATDKGAQQTGIARRQPAVKRGNWVTGYRN